MLPKPELRDRLLLYLAIAAAGLIPVSIAASQVCLGIGVAAMLFLERRLPFPRIWLPLAGLFLWTVLADLLSPDPWLGRAQIKKFFVFLLIPLLYGVFARQIERVFYLVAAWVIGATASGLLALEQFARSMHSSYMAYVGRRISGFESHWMTFGALELIVLLLLAAHWFFAQRRLPAWCYASVLILAAALLLNGTRSIWLAAIPSCVYLLAVWRPKAILLLPFVAAGAFLVAPHNVKTRILSTVHPAENIDSNEHRAVTFRTGVRMIEAHPWFGLGPEEIGPNFQAYVPADVPKPLPPGYYGHLHDIYVQYAAERGIPGLLLVLSFIGLAMWDCAAALRANRQTRGETRFLMHAAIAVTLAILTGGIFEYNLGDSEVLMMYVSVLALAYAAMKQHSDHGLSAMAQTVSKYGASVSR